MNEIVFSTVAAFILIVLHILRPFLAYKLVTRRPRFVVCRGIPIDLHIQKGAVCIIFFLSSLVFEAHLHQKPKKQLYLH